MKMHDFTPTMGNPLKCVVCGQGLEAEVHEPVTTNAIRSMLGYPPYIEIKPEKERQRILQEASKLISGDREETYGPPEVNFGVIADFWNALGFKVASYNRDLRPVDAVDVALAMSLVKTARLSHDRGHRDSWVDGPGYLALGGEIALKDAEPNGPFVEAAMKENAEMAAARFVKFRKVGSSKTKVWCEACNEQYSYSRGSDISLGLMDHTRNFHPEYAGWINPVGVTFLV